MWVHRLERPSASVACPLLAFLRQTPDSRWHSSPRSYSFLTTWDNCVALYPFRCSVCLWDWLLCTQVRCTQFYEAPSCTWIPGPMKGFPEGFRMVECIVNDSSSQALCRQHQSNIEQQFNTIASPAPTAHVQLNTATIRATTPSFIQMLRMKINGSYKMERQTKEIMIHK